jgi:cytochrome c oxidase subunit 1
MGVAATFAILGAMFFWFPKIFARRLNETLGKLHFWLTFAGVYCVFMPMHWLGLIGHSRISGVDFSTVVPLGISLRTLVAVAALLTIAAQALFLVNFVWSLWRGEKVENRNPWRATTLEWSVSSPPPIDNFGSSEPVIYRGAYEFTIQASAEDFVPQYIAPPSAETAPKAKQAAGAGEMEN